MSLQITIHHPLVDILTEKLSLIFIVPRQERELVIYRAIMAAVAWAKEKENEIAAIKKVQP